MTGKAGYHKPGRPPKYCNCMDVEFMCELYREICEEGKTEQIITKRGEVVKVTRKIPQTVIGLALFLGFKSRQSMFDYMHRGEEYSDIITRAKARVEEDLNIGAIQGDYETRTTALNLSSNHGYTTKTEQDIHDSRKGEILNDILNELSAGDPDTARRLRQAIRERVDKQEGVSPDKLH